MGLVLVPFKVNKSLIQGYINGAPIIPKGPMNLALFVRQSVRL